MKLERGHWIIAGVTGLIIAYLFLYAPVSEWWRARAARDAEPPQTATEAQQEIFDEVWRSFMTTQGLIATGTQITREDGDAITGSGTAIAELWAIREGGAVEANAIDLTSHDSADRYEEALQGLRRYKQVELLGFQLPGQTETFMADLNTGDRQCYVITTPDGAETQFCGYVTRVEAKGELAGAQVFEATIERTAGPVTETTTTSGYWHATGTSTPGTPPPDDTGNWEPVDPPDIEDGEAVFGWDEVGTSQASLYTEGAITVYSGSPLTTYVESRFVWSTAGMGEDFSGLGDSSADPDTVLSAHAVYDADTGVVAGIQAYITNGEASPLDVEGAIFKDSAQIGSLTGVSAVPANSAGWITLSFGGDAPTIVEDGSTYGIALRSEVPDGGLADISVAAGSSSDYAPPDGGEWDDEDEYEECQTVYYEETTEETYCP